MGRLIYSLGELGAIFFGIAAAIGFGWCCYIVFKGSSSSRTWGALIWSIGAILALVVWFGYVLPTAGAQIYTSNRDMYIDTVLEDLRIFARNVTGSFSQPRRNLPEIGEPESSLQDFAQPAAPEESLAPAEEAAGVIPSQPSFDQPQAGELLAGGGREAASCYSDNCPDGKCPMGCRLTSQVWTTPNGLQMGLLCNATVQMQTNAWSPFRLDSVEWLGAIDCPVVQ